MTKVGAKVRWRLRERRGRFFTEGASAPGTTSVDATEAATANAVQMVDPNEVNELDRAAAATVTVESSSITYLWVLLGAALALASAVWLFSRMTSMFARRAAGRRMQHATREIRQGAWS